MDDKRYTLMNKNRPVLDFLYNLDTHHVVKILKRRELDFAPPAILDMKGNPTRAALDSTEFSSPNPGSGKDQRTKYSRFPRFRSRGHERCFRQATM